MRTFEVAYPLMRPVVFPARRVIPFDAEPAPRRAGHWAGVPDGAEGPVVRYPVSYLDLGDHHYQLDKEIIGEATLCFEAELWIVEELKILFGTF
jgi:hypothetical protein